MSYIELLLFLICLFLVACLVLTGLVVRNSKTYPIIESLKGEDTFRDRRKDEDVKFPSLNSPPCVSLSVVVPAYNEEARLPVMLEEATEYLEEREKRDKKFSYEIIIVDDGSKDRTTEVGLEWSEKLGSDHVRVLTLHRNRGKGGAVRMGMLRARGERLLFADADGASKFEDVEKLEQKLSEVEVKGQGLVCGSRAHLEKDSIAARSFFRTVLMYGFHLCVWFFGCESIKDTQCGFKLMTRSTASLVFRSLHIERWAFDVELLKVAELCDHPLGEVSVRWTEVDGSKLDPVSASIEMFKDLFLLWFRYTLGIWKVAKSNK